MTIFQQLDSNGDGTLSVNELKEGFSKIMKEKSPDFIENILNTIDINKSGEIDYSEFVLAAIN